MAIIVERFGTPVRLTGERLAHILEHPEMLSLEGAISETLRDPAVVVQSLSDPSARLYYRFYPHTRAGGKFVCVVVKAGTNDAFVLTAYLTDSPKKGTILWTAST